MLLKTLIDRKTEIGGLEVHLAELVKSNIGWMCAGRVFNPLSLESLSLSNLMADAGRGTSSSQQQPPPSHLVECVRALGPSSHQVRLVRGV